MKGLLFGGCSFTWGQGLYFYSDLPNLYNPPQYYYYADKVTDAQIKFKDSIRYPRLVANHFNTFEVFKNANGGSEDETFNFFHNIFNDPDKLNVHSHICYERYSYDDFSYIIIQLSQLYRNKFYYEIDNQKFSSNFSPLADYIDTSDLLRWMEINNYSIEDWGRQLAEQQYHRLIKELKFYEEKGIKTKILTWENDLLGHIKNDDFLNSRLIKLNYQNKSFDTIRELTNKHKEMTIDNDPYFNGYVYTDHHPSKKCHEVIADSIIKNIEKNII
jgi:hypothetical protein